MDNCVPLGIGHHRRHVAVASDLLILMAHLFGRIRPCSFLFCLAVTPLILYLAFVVVLVVVAKLFRK